MSYGIDSDASDYHVHEAEQPHEFLVNDLRHPTFDVDVVVTADDTIKVTVAPGAAAPSTWPAAILDEYCARSRRDRRRLVEHYAFGDRISRLKPVRC